MGAQRSNRAAAAARGEASAIEDVVPFLQETMLHRSWQTARRGAQDGCPMDVVISSTFADPCSCRSRGTFSLPVLLSGGVRFARHPRLPSLCPCRGTRLVH